jgi:molybdopterin molybdotransferase
MPETMPPAADKPDLLPVEEALARILDGVTPLASEDIPLADALDRTLAADLTAVLTQPPWDTSAMDGYAVRGQDVAELPVRLEVIGAAPAGHAFAGALAPGQAVRIFTGAPLPCGADTIVIQENTEADGDGVVVHEAPAPGRFVRPKGLDFSEGDALLKAGRRLTPCDLALAAAMNRPILPLRRQPRVAILATGDELVLPGTTPGPHQIVASNGFGVAGIVKRGGGEPVDIGIARDERSEIAAAIQRAVSADPEIFVTLGGASVGEHDFVQEVLTTEGLELDFWRIAMRPGKPLMFGQLQGTRVIGLPGNPVSALVCARIFLVPLINALLGRPATGQDTEPARLGDDLPANDRRQDYLRATATQDESGQIIAMPFSRQDSSMLATLARAECLIVRQPHAPAARKSEPCRILRVNF